MPGERMAITAKHDTYGISFTVTSEGCGPAEAAQHPRVPLWVRAQHATALHACMHLCGHIRQMRPPGTSGLNTVLHCEQDPAWKAAYEDLSAVNEELSKAAVQNPPEYRALAMAAVQLGSQPHALGVDSEQACALCNRFMS